MHRAAYTMAHELADYAETIAFDVILDGSGNIDHPIACMGLRYPFIEGLFSDIHELLRQNATSTDRHGLGRVPDKAIVNDSNIEAYDVAKLQNPWPGQAMDNLFIN